jgi:hypothetical protein
LAAAATALALGIEPGAIQAGLATLMPVKGRLCPRRCGTAGVIDDTYNANPDSIAAAIQVLAGLSGRRWLILGDLAELGPEADALHREVGEIAREAGIDRLFSVGILSTSATSAFGGRMPLPTRGSRACASGRPGPGDRILVKGSRSARMEQVVEALCAARRELGAAFLAEWLSQFQTGFNVFRYLTLRAIMGVLTALAIALLVGRPMITRLRAYKVGQMVRDDGPQSHLSKAGTPTMGGALILVAVAVSTLLWADLDNRYVWIVLLTTLAFGLVGLVDDYKKLVLATRADWRRAGSISGRPSRASPRRSRSM